MRKHRRKHYYENKKQYLDRNIKRRETNYEKFLRWLSVRKCVDCGEDDLVVLECDHVRGKKIANIAELLHDASWKTILHELSKCEVRCSNCHKRRTAKIFGWKKYGCDLKGK